LPGFPGLNFQYLDSGCQRSRIHAQQGRKLRIGTAIIHLDSLRGRCVMTTYDPDCLQQDLSVLKDIVHRFDGELVLNAAVEIGGSLQVGQEVELL
jgi:uncharacterized protein